MQVVKQMIRVGALAVARALGPRSSPAGHGEDFQSPDNIGNQPLQPLGAIEEGSESLGAVHQRAVDELISELARAKRERDGWKQRADAYLATIEGIIGERDQWKDMWYADSSGHLAAQAMLEDALSTGHKMFGALLGEVNTLRREKGQSPLGWDGKENGIGVTAATQKRIEAQQASAPPDTDWRKKRDEIAGNPAVEAEPVP